MMTTLSHRRGSVLAVSLALLGSTAQAQKAPTSPEQSLEDLMQVEVSSVSNKPQRLANVAASIFVISAEDIRLSGANSIPEVLRLAPGIDATRISGNRWAVSARGFADRLSNKLLVLVDGRNVFSPAFSGVVWEELQMPLEDIERIEVVRGPGASVWGSNAVNGVINIITRSAAATQGGLAVVGGGTLEGRYGRLRWGGANAERDLYYRIYGSAQNASSQRAPYDSGKDHWQNRSAGFRVDGYAGGGTRWDISTDYAEVGAEANTVYVALGGDPNGSVLEHHRNLSLRARVEQKFANGASLQAQGTLSHSDFTIAGLADDRRTTADAGLQYRQLLGTNHDVILGSEYRFSTDTISASPISSFAVPSRALSYFSVFGQDEIALQEFLHLTLGLRMDHSPFTGWESQPTARIAWNLRPNQTIWASASKAIRAPSRGELGVNINNVAGQQTIPGLGTLPVLSQVRTGNDFRSEKLAAFELGLRSQWLPGLSSDVSLFSHHYRDLRAGDTPTVALVGGFPPTALVATTAIINAGNLVLNGVEMSADWRARPDVRLQLSYTFNDVGHIDPSAAERSNLVLPRTITSVRASWVPPVANTSVDLWWRYSGSRGTPNFQTAMRRGYTSVDLRLGRKPRHDLDIALVGQNLNNGACDAFIGVPVGADISGTKAACIGRLLVLQARMDF